MRLHRRPLTGWGRPVGPRGSGAAAGGVAGERPVERRAGLPLPPHEPAGAQLRPQLYRLLRRPGRRQRPHLLSCPEGDGHRTLELGFS